MPDSDVTLEERHFRRIDIRGSKRSDDLFEVHGRVVDHKSEDFVTWTGQRLAPAGDAVHDLGLRLVFYDHMTVVEVPTFADSTPYAVCSGGGDALQSLVVLRVTGGWNREVSARVSGARSCTHLMELRGPLATTAFQSVGFIRRQQPARLDANGWPVKIDSCCAYSAHSEQVMRH